MKKETFEPRKEECEYDDYLTENDNRAYRIFDSNGKHIKTTKLKYVIDCILSIGCIWIENNRKAFTVKELTLIRLEAFRYEIKKLYKDYPETVKSISDSPVKSRNKYAAHSSGEVPEQKYGISFENGTSIYVPERIFNLLEDAPIRHLNL